MSMKMTRRTLVSLLPVAGLVACGTSKENAGDASATASAPTTTSPAATGVRTDEGYQLNSVTEGAPTVTLYTDLMCPYCAKADPTYREAASKLDGIMNVTVRHFPLPKHANAVPAAQAVQAAEAQGAYVQMAEHLYTHQEDWKAITDTDQFNTLMGDYAQQLGLDRTRFEQDLPNEESLTLIKQEYQEGVDAGVKGTPSFVINGTALDNVDSATSVSGMVAAFKKAAGL